MTTRIMLMALLVAFALGCVSKPVSWTPDSEGKGGITLIPAVAMLTLPAHLPALERPAGTMGAAGNAENALATTCTAWRASAYVCRAAQG